MYGWISASVCFVRTTATLQICFSNLPMSLPGANNILCTPITKGRVSITLCDFNPEPNLLTTKHSKALRLDIIPNHTLFVVPAPRSAQVASGTERVEHVEFGFRVLKISSFFHHSGFRLVTTMVASNLPVEAGRAFCEFTKAH